MKYMQKLYKLFINAGLFLVLWAVTIAHAAQTEMAYTSVSRYDAAGRLTGTIAPDPDGAGVLEHPAARNTYNARGLLEKVESGELSPWLNENIQPKDWENYAAFTVHITKVYTYDSYGRKATEAIKGANGLLESLVQYSYDNQSRVQCKAMRMNKNAYTSLPSSACTQGTAGTFGPDRIFRYTYNVFDQVLTEQRGVGAGLLAQTYVTNVYYPDSPLLQSQTDANGNKTELRYDTSGRLIQRVYPSPTTKGALNESDYNAYTYDSNNNIRTERKRNGATITNTYDNNNRLVIKDLSNNTYSADVVYNYDLRGLTLHSRFGNDAGQGITNIFDGFGNLSDSTTTMGGNSRKLSYQYDNNSNRTRVTHPDNHFFAYGFDGLNRINSLSESTAQTATSGTTPLLTVSYHANGSRYQIIRTGGPGPYGTTEGSTTTYLRENANRLGSFNQNFVGTTNDLTNTFSYNPANQVTQLVQSNTQYSYAGNENRAGSYLHNGLNQYTNIGGQPLGHDANGNLINDGSIIYTYDMENRLVTTAGAVTSSFKYDPLGRLFETTIGSNTTRFLYDGDALVSEYSSIVGGSMRRRYIHGDQVDEPWVQYDTSALGVGYRYYLHADHQGSIIARTNAWGTMGNALAYDSFGIPKTTNLEGFGYTGQMWIKELGLFHYKARMYSPKLGRFLQTDPIGYADQMNLYAYVHNDPVNYFDPSGMSSEEAQKKAAEEAARIAAESRAEAFRAAGMEDTSKPLADAAKKVADGASEAGNLIEAVAAPSPAAKIGMIGIIGANIKRFFKKIPANSRGNVSTHPLPNDGVAVQATSPASNIPGSNAVYEKQIGADGSTIQFTKTTYDSEGNIVHIKDKITNQVITP